MRIRYANTHALRAHVCKGLGGVTGVTGATSLVVPTSQPVTPGFSKTGWWHFAHNHNMLDASDAARDLFIRYKIRPPNVTFPTISISLSSLE